MSATNNRFDIAVIGAGIAGASVAAELSATGQTVVLMEAEDQPGYHTTGRSAAVYSPVYGPEPIRALTRASLPFYSNPPDGFSQRPLLSPIDAVFVARSDQLETLDAMQAELAQAEGVSRIGADELYKRLPILRKGYGAAALWDTATSEIDVAALHQGYLRLFKARGGQLSTGARVTALTRCNDEWQIDSTRGQICAGVVVNAAGAWAEQLGEMAGAERIGLVPKRRTALMVNAPDGIETRGLPLSIDVQEQFYLKPDAGKLLISPANEDPEVPCDVQPDEMDIAICVDRIERAFEVQVKRIEQSWAGLRSFVSDKSPVAGYSKRVAGFYWLAGQGGYGLQSAPGLARFSCADILGRSIPEEILAQGLQPEMLAPDRAALG